MTFWSKLRNDKLVATVKINFYGNEKMASIEHVPDPSNSINIVFSIPLFLAFFTRVACDLNKDSLAVVKFFIDISAKRITKSHEGANAALSILPNDLHMIPPRSIDIYKVFIGELYMKSDGSFYIQTKYSPIRIETYGVTALIFYYSYLIETLPKKNGVKLIAMMDRLFRYYSVIGGRPKIFHVNVAATYAMHD